MTESRLCEVCEARPVGVELYVCKGCLGAYCGLLVDLGGRFDDLDAALGRQLRFGGRVGSASTESQLPIDVVVAEVAWVARQTVLTWVDWVASVRGHVVPQGWAGIGEYLVSSADWLARHPEGCKAVDEVTAALRHARRAVDRPADRQYLGFCSAALDSESRCVEPLWGVRGRELVVCPRCGREHQVHDLLGEIHRRLASVECTAVEAARLLGEVGVVLSDDLIRQWRRRGEITASRMSPEGRPMYRLGDLLDRHAGRRVGSGA